MEKIWQNMSMVFAINNVPMLTALQLCKTLTWRETGWRVHKNPLCHGWNFYANLTLVAWLLGHVPLLWPHGLYPAGSSVHGISQARVLEWDAMSFSRGSSQPRVWTRSPTLQKDSLPTEPSGKPKLDIIPKWNIFINIFDKWIRHSCIYRCISV